MITPIQGSFPLPRNWDPLSLILVQQGRMPACVLALQVVQPGWGVENTTNR